MLVLESQSIVVGEKTPLFFPFLWKRTRWFFPFSWKRTRWFFTFLWKGTRWFFSPSCEREQQLWRPIFLFPQFLIWPDQQFFLTRSLHFGRREGEWGWLISLLNSLWFLLFGYFDLSVVFQNKYQSYKYERNTVGKSAREGLGDKKRAVIPKGWLEFDRLRLGCDVNFSQPWHTSEYMILGFFSKPTFQTFLLEPASELIELRTILLMSTFCRRLYSDIYFWEQWLTF